MTEDRQREFGLEPPSPVLRLLETRALFELGSLVPRAPELLSQPRGDGRPIVLMPGFLADDRSTWPIRRYLSYLGYDTSGWGLGRNNGNPEKGADAFSARLDRTHADDSPMTLIGWSLGGVVARLVAMQRPDRVREVITMGTPVEGGPKYTSTGDFYARARGVDLDEFEKRVHEVNRTGITQPLTVIYSRTDAIVGWRAAIDRYNPQARHVEVQGSHIGLGVSPQVWRIIAETLHASGSRDG